MELKDQHRINNVIQHLQRVRKAIDLFGEISCKYVCNICKISSNRIPLYGFYLIELLLQEFAPICGNHKHLIPLKSKHVLKKRKGLITDVLLMVIANECRKGVKVKGYFYWSLFDDFEWVDGYIPRFGLYYIDYKNNLTRIPKDSVRWFQEFLKR
ncbi:hypothetical protein Dsin_013033 [Dipteronia sinensis]|uniref:Beta-glucosidase n=1 Tax=Dipteronia sinensis TaxID=43782 RepID=A0AAE0AJP2_9ROSI|nr:hypothetical protein Dsin_013033 [Dipteronia sinensis]